MADGAIPSPPCNTDNMPKDRTPFRSFWRCVELPFHCASVIRYCSLVRGWMKATASAIYAILHCGQCNNYICTVVFLISGTCVNTFLRKRNIILECPQHDSTNQ